MTEYGVPGGDARGMEMAKQMVVHLGVVRRLPFGSDATLTTTLCGRFRGLPDGMNLTTVKDEVTCKLCLQRLKFAEARRIGDEIEKRREGDELQEAKGD